MHNMFKKNVFKHCIIQQNPLTIPTTTTVARNVILKGN